MARHRAAVRGFTRTVEGVPDEAWRRPTPCTEWDAGALVEHVIGFHEFLLLGPLGVRAHRPRVGSRPRWLATDRAGGDAASAAVAALDSLATVWLLSTATWETMPGERWLLDEEGSAHAKLGAIDPTLFVVRPDTRVGFRCEPPDPTRVLEYFRSWSSVG